MGNWGYNPPKNGDITLGLVAWRVASLRLRCGFGGRLAQIIREKHWVWRGSRQRGVRDQVNLHLATWRSGKNVCMQVLWSRVCLRKNDPPKLKCTPAQSKLFPSPVALAPSCTNETSRCVARITALKDHSHSTWHQGPFQIQHGGGPMLMMGTPSWWDGCR